MQISKLSDLLVQPYVLIFSPIFSSNPFSLIKPITILMKQNQIPLPRMKDQHYSLYTMNRHRETLDIHDTRRYSGPFDQTTRWHKSEYHSDCTEMVKFFLFHLLLFICARVEHQFCDVDFFFLFSPDDQDDCIVEEGLRRK